MFSVEIDFDEILLKVVDETDTFEDVDVILYDDLVYIRQWCEDSQYYKTIALSIDMWDEVLTALGQSEGVYVKR